MAVILTKGRAISTSPIAKQKWTRPSDWLDMPAMSQGDEKIVLLVKIFEKGNNYLRFRITGDFQVDWGDGNTNTYSSNDHGEHSFSWSDISASTLTSEGFRQAIVTITPQSGSHMTVFNGRGVSPYHHPDEAYRAITNPNIISCKIASEHFTQFYQGFWNAHGMEEFEYVGTNNVTSWNNAFYGCGNLKKIVSLDTSSCTNFTAMFKLCYSLIEIPSLNTSNATTVTSMFESCTNIDYIPPMDVSSCTSLSKVFSACNALANNPLTNVSGITNVDTLFASCFRLTSFEATMPNLSVVYRFFDGCAALQSVKLTVNTGSLTSFRYVFRNCTSLSEIKPVDTSNVTNFDYCFSGIKAIKDFTWVDFSSATSVAEMFSNSNIEDASWITLGSSITNCIDMFFSCKKLVKAPASIDCTNVTTLQDLFSTCYMLKELPTFTNTGSIVNMYGTFFNCRALTSIPLVTTNALTSFRAMVSGCYNLQSIPAFNLSGATAFPNGYQFAQSCFALTESNVTGASTQHSYINCGMERAELVAMFNNLGTNTDGRTLNVQKNPGTAELTASDLAIATGKGWTLLT
jgi:hypothetical protein